jgi:ABC-type nickel/cobalt efflux system permease component RcnA
VLLGVIVSAMHTASVLALAFVLYQVNRSTPVDRIYPWLTIASGSVVISLGVYLLLTRVRAKRTREHTHDHDHDDHGHDHHEHDHGPGGHTHELPADVPPLSRRGLILLASSGGLLPSPSAVLALLGAFVAGRAALGFGLVAAFSVGLALTLTGIGLVLVLGGRVIERRGLRNARLVNWLPLGGAVAVAFVGVVIASQGVTHL